MNPELERKLRSLRLFGMAAARDARNQEAIHHQLAFTDFLGLLMEDEVAQRRHLATLHQCVATQVQMVTPSFVSFSISSPDMPSSSPYT